MHNHPKSMAYINICYSEKCAYPRTDPIYLSTIRHGTKKTSTVSDAAGALW